MEQLIDFLNTVIFAIGDPQNVNSYQFTFWNLMYVSILMIGIGFILSTYKN
ncbi:MAG: hypothetical protein HC803_03140 [Saprospiraceae bacterium]|nr:hypothetical protein [Saprospiraceae bacterium]